MLKIEKCIINYACFKHPWVLEVMFMSVDINEKIVLRLWSPGTFDRLQTKPSSKLEILHTLLILKVIFT